MILLTVVIFVALVFEFINGFHDTANAIATVVATKVLTPRQAIMLASVTNLLGALVGTAVAKTIAAGIITNDAFINAHTLLAALLGAIAWNLITWWQGLPSSSSHALIGGLAGAVLASTNFDMASINWSDTSALHWYQWSGIIWKVGLPMILSPILGFVCGYLLLHFLYLILRVFDPDKKKSIGVFGKLQIFSAASMGFMHGTNDAQKTIGVIFLAILTLQPDLIADKTVIPVWIKLVCAVTIAAGTSVGGWRIIKTLGERIVQIKPIQGFAAEASSSSILHLASTMGIPVSTTHNITASVLGVGTAKNHERVNWSVVKSILLAWVFTFPASALMSFIFLAVLNLIF